MSDRLYRSREERMLAGVAGGVAEMLDIDPSLVRIVWALLAVLTGGIGLLVYIIMAIVVPQAPDGFVPAPGSAAGVPHGEAAPMRTDPMQPGATGWVGPNAQVDQAQGTGSAGGWLAPDGSVVPIGAGPTPEQAASARNRRRQRDRSGGLIAGAILIAIGGFFLLRQFMPSIDPGLWWPVAAIVTGAVLVVIAVLPSRRASG